MKIEIELDDKCFRTEPTAAEKIGAFNLIADHLMKGRDAGVLRKYHVTIGTWKVKEFWKGGD